MSDYAASEVRALLKRGTQPDEDFFRMKITGNGETMWVNITPAQLEVIGIIVDDAAMVRAVEAGALAIQNHDASEDGFPFRYSDPKKDARLAIEAALPFLITTPGLES